MAEWYYAKGNVQHGPVSVTEIKRMAAGGELAPSDLVWNEGLTDWTAAGSSKELFPDATPYPAKNATPPPRARTDYVDEDAGWRRRDLFPIRRSLSTGAKLAIILGIATGVAAIAILSTVLILNLGGPT